MFDKHLSPTKSRDKCNLWALSFHKPSQLLSLSQLNRFLTTFGFLHVQEIDGTQDILEVKQDQQLRQVSLPHSTKN